MATFEALEVEMRDLQVTLAQMQRAERDRDIDTVKSILKTDASADDKVRRLRNYLDV